MISVRWGGMIVATVLVIWLLSYELGQSSRGRANGAEIQPRILYPAEFQVTAVTETRTATATPSSTRTPKVTKSPLATPSHTSSNFASRSHTPSSSVSTSYSPTASETASCTPTSSITSSGTPTSSETPTQTPSSTVSSSPLSTYAPLAIPARTPEGESLVGIAGGFAGVAILAFMVSLVMLCVAPKSLLENAWANILSGCLIFLFFTRAAYIMAASAASARIESWPCYVGTKYDLDGEAVVAGGIMSSSVGNTVLQFCTQMPPEQWQDLSTLVHWLYLPKEVTSPSPSFDVTAYGTPITSGIAMEVAMGWFWTILSTLCWAAVMRCPGRLRVKSIYPTRATVMTVSLVISMAIMGFPNIFPGVLHMQLLSVTCIPMGAGGPVCDIISGVSSMIYSYVWTAMLSLAFCMLIVSGICFGCIILYLICAKRDEGRWLVTHTIGGVVTSSHIVDNTHNAGHNRRVEKTAGEMLSGCFLPSLCAIIPVLILWMLISPIVATIGAITIAKSTHNHPQWPVQELSTGVLGFASPYPGPAEHPTFTALHAIGSVTMSVGWFTLFAAAMRWMLAISCEGRGGASFKHAQHTAYQHVDVQTQANAYQEVYAQGAAYVDVPPASNTGYVPLWTGDDPEV